MKTRRRKMMRKIMSIMLLFVLLLTPIQANSGRINIQLKDLPGDWDEKAGVVFTLYQVGKMSDDGKAELDAKYDMSLPSDAQGLQKIAKKLTAKEGKELIEKKTTDKNGCLSFENVKNGIYLLVPSHMEAYGSIDPFIVTLPMYEEVNNTIQGPTYMLQIEPKASPNEEPIKPVPPVDPDDPEVPDVEEPEKPVEPDKPVEPEKPVEPDQPDKEPNVPETNEPQKEPNKPETPQKEPSKPEEPEKETEETKTGDTTRRGLYVLLIMLSGFGMYIIYNKHRKGSELHEEG